MLQGFKTKVRDFMKKEEGVTLEFSDREVKNLYYTIQSLKRGASLSPELEENIVGYKFRFGVGDYKAGEEVSNLNLSGVSPEYEVISEEDMGMFAKDSYTILLDQNHPISRVIKSYYEQLQKAWGSKRNSLTITTTLGSRVSYNFSDDTIVGEDSYAGGVVYDIVTTVLERVVTTPVTDGKRFSKREEKEELAIGKMFDEVSSTFVRLSYENQKVFLSTIGKKIDAYSLRLENSGVEDGKGVLLEKLPEFAQLMQAESSSLLESDINTVLNTVESHKISNNLLNEKLLWHTKNLEKSFEL